MIKSQQKSRRYNQTQFCNIIIYFKSWFHAYAKGFALCEIEKKIST